MHLPLEVKALLLELREGSFQVRKVSDQPVSSELVVNPSVKNPDRDIVDPDIGPHEHEEAVVHHPKPHVSSAVPLIAKLVLKQSYLPVVYNWVAFP